MTEELLEGVADEFRAVVDIERSWESQQPPIFEAMGTFGGCFSQEVVHFQQVC